MVVGRIKQYKARQVSLYHLINGGTLTHTYIHVNSFKETRQSKQLRLLKRKNELPRAGFEPATFCVLGERSTN